MQIGKSLSLLLPLAAWLGAQGCTDNPAAYDGILGPTRESPEGSASAGGTGGSGAGGSATGGSATGGTQSTAGGEGGMGDGGVAGTSGTGGSAGTVVNPPPHPDFMPPCFQFTTTAGEEILKGTPCTSDDPQQCYRPCGPAQVGWKLEECRAGVYAEEDCSFPLDGDYSCYRLPDDPEDIDETACQVTAPPAATDECAAPACMACNFEGFYEDTGGDAKEGYCVCRDPDEMGVRRWTCASTTAWPCPTNNGCF
jgi:hypothetical protein